MISVKDLDNREMPSRNDIEATVSNPYPLPGPKDQQNKMYYLHLALCNFIALKGS